MSKSLSHYTSDTTLVKVAAAAILGVLAVFLIVLLVGSPVTVFGNKESSFLYSIVVLLPIAVVCVYVFSRK